MSSQGLKAIDSKGREPKKGTNLLHGVATGDRPERRNMIEAKGSCKYCGQIIMVQVPEEADQTDIDEEATMRCECLPALIYQKHKEFKEKAEIAIDTLIEDEHVNKAMKTMAAYVADRYVDSVSMASGERKYTISAGKYGPKVTVTLTRKKSIG